MTNDTVRVGSVAPEFTLEASGGSFSLEGYRHRGNVVLYFMRAFN